jgi:hypothetical protein
MPQNASWALQKAIYQALANEAVLTALLGAGKIFDDVPQGASFPYLTIGQATARDWSTATEEGCEHILTLQAWSKDAGRKGIAAIMQAVHDILHGAPLALEDHILINLRHDFTDLNRDKGGEAYHGLTRYRAVTEPVN